MNDPLNGSDGGSDIAVAPDGTRVYVTGWFQSPTGFAFQTLAYAVSSGRTIWSSRFDDGGYDTPQAMVLSPDGTRVFVTGRASPGGEDISTVAYDSATGVQLWSATYDDPLDGGDLPFAIAISPDGTKVFVAGVTTQVGNSAPPTVIAYDASTGTQLWVGTSPAQGDYFGVGVSPDGTLVFATGECCQATTDDYITSAFDSTTGVEVWEAQYNAKNGQDAALGLAVSPSGGSVFVTGFSQGATHTQYATIAYSATSGAPLWVSRYDGQHHLGGSAEAIGISPDGDTIYVSGEAEVGVLNTYGTVAYDSATGVQLWASEYQPIRGLNEPAALAVAPNGSGVYVTGFGEVRSAIFYLTLAYDPSSGHQRWAAAYTGPDPPADYALAVGTTSDGSLVFVTGQSYGPTDSDFATIAYRA